MPHRWTEADVRAFCKGTTTRRRKPLLPRVEGFPCTEEVFLVLPYPPLNNRYYRHLPGRVGPLLSAEGRQYRALVAQIIQVEWPRSVPWPFNTLVDVTIMLHAPSLRHRPDADAFAKAPLDALQHAGVYVNDSLVHDLHLLKREPRPPFGSLDVWIRPSKGVL